MIQRYGVKIWGHVQGIFFRAFIRDHARSLGLTGWVKNLPGGEIEALFEGEKENIDKMVELCNAGYSRASVEKMRVSKRKGKRRHKEFQIVR